jgi:hypothetical protein
VNSQRMMHRAWDNVHKFDSEARKHCATYRQACCTLQCLSINLEYVVTLHDITEDDFKVAGDLTDEWRFGQRSDTHIIQWNVPIVDLPADLTIPHF